MTLEPHSFQKLESYLMKIPAIQVPISSGAETAGWWMKFSIDVDHQLVWHTVQELGHVLNYLSLNERLPTVFKPVSPPPYLNGGPDEFLSWVIECTQLDFSPGLVADWLEGRLPRPVEDLSQWMLDEEE